MEKPVFKVHHFHIFGFNSESSSQNLDRSLFGLQRAFENVCSRYRDEVFWVSTKNFLGFNIELISIS